MQTDSSLAALVNQMRSRGLECQEPLQADGQIHRFEPGKPNGRDSYAWYVIYAHHTRSGQPWFAGAFGSWKSGETHSFSSGNIALETRADQRRLQQLISQAQQQAQAARQQEQEWAASNAVALWNTLIDGPIPPYLRRKQIEQLYGARLDPHQPSHLYVPLRDRTGQLWNLQVIYPQKNAAGQDKWFQKHGRLSGCFHLIGQLTPGVLYLVEGFATGCSVHMATERPVVCALAANNLLPVFQAFKSDEDFQLVIAADDDRFTPLAHGGNVGRTKAYAIAGQFGCQVFTPQFASLDGHPTDFNDLHVREGLAVVRAQLLDSQQALRATLEHLIAQQPRATAADLASQLLTTVTPSPEPLPLTPAPLPSLPYPIEALGTLLGEAVRGILYLTQFPDALPAQSILMAAAYAAQGLANIQLVAPEEGLPVPLSLYGTLIGKTGEGKGRTESFTLRPHRALQRQLAEQYERELRQWSKATAGEDGYFYTATGEKISKPREPFMLLETPTWQGIMETLRNGQPSLFLATDEGGGMLGSYAMNKDNQLMTVSALTKMFDGQEAKKMTGNSGRYILYDRRLSISMQIQPRLAHDLMLINESVKSQGWFSRILFCYPPSTQGTRFTHPDTAAHQQHKAVAQQAIARYCQRMTELMAMTQVEPHTGSLQLQTLTLSPAAKAAWEQLSDRIEAAIGVDQSHYEVHALVNKYAQIAGRIAGILFLVDNPDCLRPLEGDYPRQISEPLPVSYMEPAITLIEFYLAESLRIFGSVLIVDNYQARALQLLEWLRHPQGKELQGKTLLSLRDILRYGPHAIQKGGRNALLNLLHYLEEHGYGQLQRVNPHQFRWLTFSQPEHNLHNRSPPYDTHDTATLAR